MSYSVLDKYHYKVSLKAGNPFMIYYRVSLWRHWAHVIAGITIYTNTVFKDDEGCYRCRTQRGYLAYSIGKITILINTESLLGSVLWRIHQLTSNKTIWCKYDKVRMKNEE